MTDREALEVIKAMIPLIAMGFVGLLVALCDLRRETKPKQRLHMAGSFCAWLFGVGGMLLGIAVVAPCSTIAAIYCGVCFLVLMPVCGRYLDYAFA